MYDMFDINLLSQIQALDRKFSVANEKPRLKRKGTDDHKQKSSPFHESKLMKTVTNNNANNEQESDNNIESPHANIDITV